MSDYGETSFLGRIRNLTEEEIEFLHQQLQYVYLSGEKYGQPVEEGEYDDSQTIGYRFLLTGWYKLDPEKHVQEPFEYEFSTDDRGRTTLEVFSERGGDVESAARFLQRFAVMCRPNSFSWINYYDREGDPAVVVATASAIYHYTCREISNICVGST